MLHCCRFFQKKNLLLQLIGLFKNLELKKMSHIFQIDLVERLTFILSALSLSPYFRFRCFEDSSEL